MSIAGGHFFCVDSNINLYAVCSCAVGGLKILFRETAFFDSESSYPLYQLIFWG